MAVMVLSSATQNCPSLVLFQLCGVDDTDFYSNHKYMLAVKFLCCFLLWLSGALASPFFCLILHPKVCLTSLNSDNILKLVLSLFQKFISMFHTGNLGKMKKKKASTSLGFAKAYCICFWEKLLACYMQEDFFL